MRRTRKEQKMPSLTAQLNTRLQEKFRPGVSKHEAKKQGIAKNYIYSYKSFENYQKYGRLFLSWVKEQNPKIKKLDECLPYAQSYLDFCAKRLSPATVKVYASAIAKIYGLTTEQARAGEKQAKSPFITPKQERKNIKRSRLATKSDNRFSESKNSDFVEFCCCCGGRRNDLQNLKVSDIDIDSMTITFRDSKGGKTRTAPFIGGRETLASLIKGKSGDDLVFSKLHTHADIHSYRAEYASRLYAMHARPISTLSRKEVYCGRKDRKGVRLDKRAMYIVSQALGHNRVSVMADHYLYYL